MKCITMTYSKPIEVLYNDTNPLPMLVLIRFMEAIKIMKKYLQEQIHFIQKTEHF